MKNSKANGLRECFFIDGGLASRVNLLDDQLEGLAEYFNPQGQLYAKEFWRNKKLEDVEYFDENGKQLINGPSSFRHNNGQMGARAMITEGHKQGLSLTFHKDGSLQSKAYYVDSLLEGEVEAYHLNGELAYTTSYKKGLRDGVAKEFALDGTTLLWEGEFKEGDLVEK